ncbi:MAG: Gfo/Idh/MocA family oxidoreductase [Bacilli bacterium]
MENNIINVCIVGGGNISNTRHIPALKSLKNVNIIGVISNRQKSIDRTVSKWHIPNQLVIDDPENDIEKLKKCEWFKTVDAVVIGTPPNQHYPLAKICLSLSKHTLVEKPMMMNKEECDELIKLAKLKKRQFCVMHNFQYADQMQKLTNIIDSKKCGNITSITEVQFTNKNRRLPEWYNELPLGLFYDEAAHFIYLLQRHLGKLEINNAFAVYDNIKTATPITLNVDAESCNVPIHMMLNFDSPICEWYYMVSFEKEIYIYDFFKDILIKQKTDNMHLSKDILSNSLSYTFQYWWGFFKNGFKMVFGKLLYGQNVVMKKFIDGIVTNKYDLSIQAERGRETVISMNDIINKVNK